MLLCFVPWLIITDPCVFYSCLLDRHFLVFTVGHMKSYLCSPLTQCRWYDSGRNVFYVFLGLCLVATTGMVTVLNNVGVEPLGQEALQAGPLMPAGMEPLSLQDYICEVDRSHAGLPNTVSRSHDLLPITVHEAVATYA